MSVTEIKEAITHLSPREYCELMATLRPPGEDDEWDRQMKADFAAGKMDWLVKETENAIRDGETVPLETVLSDGE